MTLKDILSLVQAAVGGDNVMAQRSLNELMKEQGLPEIEFPKLVLIEEAQGYDIEPSKSVAYVKELKESGSYLVPIDIMPIETSEDVFYVFGLDADGYFWQYFDENLDENVEELIGRINDCSKFTKDHGLHAKIKSPAEWNFDKDYLQSRPKLLEAFKLICEKPIDDWD